MSKQNDFEQRVKSARDIELVRSMKCSVLESSKLIACSIHFPGNMGENNVLASKLTVNPGTSFSASINPNDNSFMFATNSKLEAPLAAETCVRIGRNKAAIKEFPDLPAAFNIDETDGIYDEIECNPSKEFEEAINDKLGETWEGRKTGTTKEEQLQGYNWH